MNKIFAVIIVSMLAIAVSPSYALGSQSFGKGKVDFQDNVITDKEIELASSLPDPGILPDHPLYFLKRAGERVRLFLAFGSEEKAKLHLDFAKVRLSEAKRLAEQNKSVEMPVDDFSSELNQSKQGKIRKEAGDLAARSAIVLAQVLEKVPARAKPAIERALNRSVEKRIEIRAELENKSREEIRKEIDIDENNRKILREDRARNRASNASAASAVP